MGENAAGSATDGEAHVTDKIFQGISKVTYFIADFSDSGNQIFLTDVRDDSCYTITVKQDE